ncbi:phosphomannose isomerase type II C-terminal cupin domain [Alphaproteobacteria bacterium]|nr:phosphomannose isomerase type II C-terminal cupin domain [Alphaproteobacteria bacterium]
MKSIVLKPWGSYEVLEKGSKYSVKRILVKSGGILSLQSHLHRSEHWIIVQGIAEVTLDENIKILKTNENIFIPMNSKHRLANKQKEDLIVIEVWYGQNLDEKDIVRYDDIYNRK